MRSISLSFAQAVPVPSPTPRPGGGGSGGGPAIDLGPLLDALNPEHLFGDVVLFIARQLVSGMSRVLDLLWHSGANIFTYTSPELSYRYQPVADLLLGTRVLVAAITALGIVLAAAALAGRHVFGWEEDLGEHVGRFTLAAILGNGAPIWVRQAIDWNNQLCEAIGAAALFPGFSGIPPDAISSSLIILALVFFGLKLGFKMLYRIGMLWVLIPIAPLALACWAIPQAQWVATTWTRQFVGWTFGQVLVTIALKLGFVAGPFGPGGVSDSGLIFSIAMAALSSDLVDLLIYGSVPRFSTARGATSVVRAAHSIGTNFSKHWPKSGVFPRERRLPGF